MGTGEFISDFACVLVDSSIPENNFSSAVWARKNIRPNNVVYFPDHSNFIEIWLLRAFNKLSCRFDLIGCWLMKRLIHPATLPIYFSKNSA